MNSIKTSLMERIALGLVALLPVTFYAGKAPIDINLSLLGLLFLVHSAMARDWRWLRESWFIAAIIFWVYLIANGAFISENSKGMSGALPWIRYPLFTAAMLVFCQNTLTQKRFFQSLAAVLTFVSANIFLQYFTGSDLFGNASYHNTEVTRLTAITGNANVGFITALLSLPLIFAISKYRWSARPALLTISVAALLLTAIYLTGERMATLFYALGLCLMLGCYALNGRKKIAFTLLACFALLIIGIYKSDSPLKASMERTVASISHFETTSYGKILTHAIGVFENAPLTGVGTRQFRYHCLSGGGDTAYLCKEGGTHRFNHPHNIYLELLSEHGVIGLLLFLAIPVLLVRDMLRHAPRIWLDSLLCSVLIAGLLRLFPLASTSSFYYAWSIGALWLWLGFAGAMARSKHSKAD